MAELNTGYTGQDGQVVHPVLFNTAKDGSGTWYVALVDANGKLLLAANSGVDIGDVDILSIAAGTNIIGKVSHDKSGIGHGRQVVTTAGTDVALAASTVAKVVIITAETDNTGVIAVGGSGVDAVLATRTGTPLSAGDSLTLEIDNLADVFIDATVSGDGVTYSYLS